MPFVNQAVPGSSLLSGGPGPVPPWSENDQTVAGENPKSDNLRPETGAVAWSIRGAGSSRQVEVAWQAPSSLPYTAPPPLHHRWKTRAKRLLSLSGSSLQTDRPSCQTSWALGEGRAAHNVYISIVSRAVTNLLIILVPIHHNECQVKRMTFCMRGEKLEVTLTSKIFLCSK